MPLVVVKQMWDINGLRKLKIDPTDYGPERNALDFTFQAQEEDPLVRTDLSWLLSSDRRSQQSILVHTRLEYVSNDLLNTRSNLLAAA